MPQGSRFRLPTAGRDLWLAAAGFVALAIAATWPLGRALSTSLPADYGDPLFVTWVMAWVARHFTRALQGDVGALASMWDAPIFVPEANTLAYSEHFAGQAFQALSIYWLTGNPLLAYNLIFLSTFVLSGLGAYLLVRELTGSRLGGAVAGALFAVNQYRGASLSHLHTLSAHWVPIALWGLLVFARSGSRRALAVGALGVVALNTSSGYYMLYFGPFIAAFTLVALTQHTAWRSRSGWVALTLAGIAVALVQVPFVLPYLELQRATQFARGRAEVEQFSLTLDLYRSQVAYWAPALLLSAAALLAWRRPAAAPRWAVGFFAVAGVLGVWLSLGPVPRLNGAPAGLPGLYDLLFTYVPGYSGLRVASRFAMVLTLALAVLAGIGAAELARRGRRAGAMLAAAAALAHLVLQWTGPIPLNGPIRGADLHATPGYLRPSAEVPDIYRFVAATEPSAVLVELPFGDPEYELRYMFFGLAHERPLLNGYSGVFPPSYRRRAALLADPPANSAGAWEALEPATHVLVHTGAWDDDRRTRIGQWLAAHGASAVVERDGAVLWHLPSTR